MTLRKFLRFFKHFPRYMAYDIKWLKNKIFRKKNTEEKPGDMPKDLLKALVKIKKETGNTHAIRHGNCYYVPFKNAPWRFCEIWRKDDAVHVKIDGKGYMTLVTTKVCYEEGMLGKWISRVFVMSDGSPDEMFAIKVKGLANTSMVQEKKDGKDFYKIYVTQGTQRPRLMYTIDYMDKDNGTYEAHMRSSRGGVNNTFILSYFPMQVLKSAPLTKLVSEY